MRDLRLGGVAVCDSALTQRSYRAAYCDFLLPVTPKTLDTALSEFRRKGELGVYRGLRLQGIADLGFLKAFPNLLYLEIVEQKRVDTQPLKELSNLRGLRLETPGAGIDFSWFPELEVFVGDWHSDNCNVARAQELRTLRTWSFKPQSADLSDFAHCIRLERLALIQTNITSLTGVETLEDLRYLDVSHAPKLDSLAALAADGVAIRELTFEKAKAIGSYQPIGQIRRLRRLKLSWCAPMPDLKWTTGMDHLDFLSLVETTVEDGNLARLLDLPRLRYVGTMDKKHYSHKASQLNELLGRRSESGKSEPIR